MADTRSDLLPTGPNGGANKLPVDEVLPGFHKWWGDAGRDRHWPVIPWPMNNSKDVGAVDVIEAALRP